MLPHLRDETETIRMEIVHYYIHTTAMHYSILMVMIGYEAHFTFSAAMFRKCQVA